MSRKMKITIIATVIIIILTVLCSFNSIVSGKSNEAEVSMKTLYALDGREIIVPEEKVDAYIKVGWYLKPAMLVYNLKQEQISIYKEQFAAYHEVGWYSEPVVQIYNLQGKEFIICKKDLNSYLNQGYYLTKPKVNYNDMVLLARVIHAEASENPSIRITDRRYVGAVVMNRVAHPSFPNTLSGVVYQRRQYACVGNSKFNSYPPQECLDIAKQLLLGERFGVPSNVVFQAQFRQGKGLWKKVGVHYYCYI